MFYRNKKPSLHSTTFSATCWFLGCLSATWKSQHVHSEHQKLPWDRITPPLLTQAIDTRRHFVVPHKQHPAFGVELHTSFNCCVLWKKKKKIPLDVLEWCGFLCQAWFTQGPPAEIQCAWILKAMGKMFCWQAAKTQGHVFPCKHKSCPPLEPRPPLPLHLWQKSSFGYLGWLRGVIYTHRPRLQQEIQLNKGT